MIVTKISIGTGSKIGLPFGNGIDVVDDDDSLKFFVVVVVVVVVHSIVHSFADAVVLREMKTSLPSSITMMIRIQSCC